MGRRMSKGSITEQLRRNTVALISLVVAITSLGYNTWRNEHTEHNRNQRDASFQVLLKLGELDELINYVHYDCNLTFRGNTKSGWAIVQAIEDLTLVLEEMSPERARRIKATWTDNFEQLEYADERACEERSAARRAAGETAVRNIRSEMAALRQRVVEILHSLE